MTKLSGFGASQGIAIGPLHFLKQNNLSVTRRRITDIQQELTRFSQSKSTALEQLGSLYQTALQQVGQQGAQLFEIHQMMLEDDDYNESVQNIIEKQCVNAEYAVAITSDNFSRMFSEMDDPYMQARSADVRDISDRVITILVGEQPAAHAFDQPVVLAAADLMPSETVQLDKKMILAFVTADGASNSHTAILARTMGIPAVIQLGDALKPSMQGLSVGVDGFTGEVYIEPDKSTRLMLDNKKAQEKHKNAMLERLKGLDAETAYGQRVLTYANIGSTADLGAVLLNDAEGIGLFRTEFLYLERNQAPSENEQFQIYRTVVESMAGKRVIFRTLDIGADKQADYFNLPAEQNPAMGLRAIRICLTRHDLFRDQIRALLRASDYGKLAMMFPMITSTWELLEIKKLLDEIKQEFREANIAFDQSIEIGIMIETPAAAVISNQLAQHVDFFSVGTNDLTQYTMAIDRQNQSLERFYDPYHPALLEMIRVSAENAHKHGKWIGICGELAADLTMTETFLAFGIDELSVAPTSILAVRDKVRGITQDRTQEILAQHLTTI